MSIANFIMHSISTFPMYALYLIVTFVLIGAFIEFHRWFTHYEEFELIHSGDVAAAVAFVGSVAGFVAPLVVLIARADGIFDLLVWAVIAAIIQVLAFQLVHFVYRDITVQVKTGNIAAGIMLGGASLILGIVNAACMLG